MNSLIVASGYPIRSTPHSAYRGLREVITTSRISYKPDEYIFSLRAEVISDIKASHYSFETCCELQIQSLEKIDKPISLLWSGGIDSTVAIISILKFGSAALKSRTTILMNVHSLKEYPELFETIAQNFKIESSFQELQKFTDLGLLITGELGDQLFGSDLIYELVPQFGEESIFKPYKEVLPSFFTSRFGDKKGRYYYDLFEPIVKESPISVKSCFDFLWWWNFSQKWQHVKFRYLLNGEWSNIEKSIQNTKHFFDTPEFQMWSMNNHDKKIFENIDSYKQIAKELIVNYTNQTKYMNKIKVGSLGYLWFGKKIHFALDAEKSYVSASDELKFRRNVI